MLNQMHHNKTGRLSGVPPGERGGPGSPRPPARWWSAGVAQWPRDTRDTLFLLAVIGWIMLMQVSHTPWWCSVLTAVVLVWRAVLALRGQPMVHWGWRILLLLLTLWATWKSHGSLLGKEPGVTLIVVLLALKTLELRARRDAFVVFFLGFFTLLTHFFYSQSLLTAAGVLLALLGLLTALVNAHMPVGRPPLAQAAGIAVRLAALGAPIMLLAFMLFPRVSPLWGMPGEDTATRTGLSGTMRVGQIAELVLDDRIAMRLKFDGEVPAQRDLYFRGPVLGDFDGAVWTPTESTQALDPSLAAQLEVLGDPVSYEVTLEPHQRSWVLLLEATDQKPEIPDARVFMTRDLQWLSSRAITSLIRYRAQSHVQFRHGPRQAVAGLQVFTELPAQSNPRTQAWARELGQMHGGDPAAVINEVLSRLRTGGYTYTLDPGVYGQHTADEFWFDRKEGFCEHIASSFVILMRAAGIPARVVTGYQGGELNGFDGYWIVRQRDAHAWAEVWLKGQGWVRVDPTSAVAPGRTGSLQRLTAPQGAIASAMQALSPDMLSRLRQVWDAANNRWNQWVLNYTQDRQLDLLKKLGFESPSWTDLAYVLIGVIVLVSLLGAAWMLWERQQHDPWLRLLERARRRLRALGLQAGPASTPRGLIRDLGEHLEPSDFTRSLSAWLLRLEALRYDRQSPDTLARLQNEWRRIEWPSARKTP